MANTRTFYAVYQVAIKDNAAVPTHNIAPVNSREFASGWHSDVVDEVAGLWEVVRGVQSVGVTTNFATQQAFELGQIELYEVSENLPEVEATIEKVLDGTKPMFFMVTDPAYNANIVGKTASFRCDVALGIYADTQTRAQNDPKTISTLSGMYLSSLTYTFPVDGFCTEQVTLVGNDKLWAVLDTGVSGLAYNHSSASTNAGSDAHAPEGIPLGAFSGLAELAGGTAVASVSTVIGSGIQKRQNVALERSVLPSDLPGMSGHQTATIAGNTVGGFTAANTVVRYTSNVQNIIEKIQNITLSVDFGREDIFELGQKRPFSKYASFPVQTTAAIEVISSEGDLVEAVSTANRNTADVTIVVRTDDGLQIDLGDSCYLESIDKSGGDTGGGNLTVTYNYVGFNTFNVTHDRFCPNHRVYVETVAGTRFA
jgi:hypothetical protein